MADESMLIQDHQDNGLVSALGAPWRLVTDGVMGGLSSGSLKKDTIDGKQCIRLRGDVSLKNNGGFIQAALDVDDTPAENASAYQGIMLEVYGNDEEYNLHLRTKDLWLPWQSYRATFVAPPKWRVIKLPFSTFTRYRTWTALDPGQLKRIALVAIGQEFTAGHDKRK